MLGLAPANTQFCVSYLYQVSKQQAAAGRDGVKHVMELSCSHHHFLENQTKYNEQEFVPFPDQLNRCKSY